MGNARAKFRQNPRQKNAHKNGNFAIFDTSWIFAFSRPSFGPKTLPMGSGNQILPVPKISGGLAVTEWYFVPFFGDLHPSPKKSTFSGIFFSNFTSSWDINITLSNQTVLPSQTTYDYGSSETTKILGLPPMVLASGLKAQSHSGKKIQKMKFLNFASFYSARTPPPCTTDPMLVNTGTVATYFRSFLFLLQHRVL